MGRIYTRPRRFSNLTLLLACFMGLGFLSTLAAAQPTSGPFPIIAPVNGNREVLTTALKAGQERVKDPS